jgi:hypothetical protein
MAIGTFVGPKILWRNAGVVSCFTAAVLTLAMLVLFILQGIGATTVIRSVNASGITPTGGFGYVYVLYPQFSFLQLLTRGDNTDDPWTSRLVLRQDGVIIGTPHSRHDEIVSHGHGRYSHWLGNLYFSTPDNTDPRVNGHVYTIDLPHVVPPWLILSALAVQALALGGIVSRGAKMAGWKKDTLFLLILVQTAGVLAALTMGSVGYPAIVNNTDGGNIGGFIAGQMFPGRFASDFLVSDSQNTGFYVSVVLPLVKFFSVLTGDIGTAYLWIELPILLVQVTGFYLLGKKMVQSRLWAAVLALMTCTPIFIWGQNDVFGAFWLPLVRMTYDAALPWLMLAFWTHGRRAWMLPLLFAASGFCIYLHPVSAPAGVAGLSLASLAFLRRDEPFWLRIAFLAVGAVVFGLIAIPFAIPFLSSFSGGEAVAGTELHARAMEEFRRVNGPVYYDALLAFRTFIVGTGSIGWPVWLIGVVGLALVPVFNPARRTLCLFLSLFLAGCLIASVGICIVDQAIASMLHRTPFQLDLIRGLRLVIAPILIGFVLSLTEMQRALESIPRYRIAARALAGSAVLIVAGWWTVHPNRISDAIGLARLANDFRHQNPDETKMIGYLREKPVDGTILPIVPATLGLAVRYAALQPIAFIKNDVNALFYSGSAKRLLWTEFDALRNGMQEKGPGSVAAYAALSERSKARYVLVADDAVSAGLLMEILNSGQEIARFGGLSLVDLGTQR